MRILQAMVAVTVIGWLTLSSLPDSRVQAEEDLPRFQEILKDIKAFTARVKQAETDQQKIDAVVDLSSLYLHIVSDPRFARAEKLQGYRGRIAGRLRDEQKRITRLLKKKSDQQVSARSSYTSDDESFLIRSAIDHHWQLLSHAVGGTGPTMYHASGQFGTTGHFAKGQAGGIIGDHGRELVNLIETILHPDFWQVNGGAGTIYYYQPLRILVVRATTTVHEDLTDFLEQLR